MICKLAALLEYLNWFLHFHARNFANFACTTIKFDKPTQAIHMPTTSTRKYNFLASFKAKFSHIQLG